MTEEHKRKLSEAAKLSNTTRPISDETRAKLSLAAKNRAKTTLPEGMKLRKLHFSIDGIMHKDCSVCKRATPLHSFVRNARAKWDGLTSDCKDCRNERTSREYHSGAKTVRNSKNIQRKRAIKLELVELKGNKCHKCGIEHIPNHNTSIFQFHHRDPKQKDFAIADFRTRDISKLQEELDKCDMLCANCHHILHWSLKEDL